MTETEKPLTIREVERSQEGLIITFSNGTLARFSPQFLFNTKDDDGNTSLDTSEPD